MSDQDWIGGVVRMSDEELGQAVLRARLNNPIVMAIENVGAQEGWTDVRTLRATVLALSVECERLLSQSSELLKRGRGPAVLCTSGGAADGVIARQSDP